MEIFMGIIFFVLGLCVGSFLNMAIYRLALQYRLLRRKKAPRNDVNGRSYCDFCGRQLYWYENIPVLSWIMQLGKTRCCSNPLPWEYPIIEITTGMLFLLIFNFQFSIFNLIDNWQLLIELLIASLLVFSLVFDLKYMILPDRTNLALIVIALILNPFNLLIGLGSMLFFFILNRIKIRGSEAMGMGDVKYALFMGLFLGFPNIIVAIYFAFIIGAIISLILLFLKIVKRENPIPFGPFLILGTAVAKVWGEKLINYFFGVLL